MVLGSAAAAAAATLLSSDAAVDPTAAGSMLLYLRLWGIPAGSVPFARIQNILLFLLLSLLCL